MNANKEIGIREISITVVEHVITLDVENLSMGYEKEQEIVWIVRTPGWFFPHFEDGIEVKVGHGEFSNGHADESRTRFVMRNKNTFEHSYPYTIKVTNGKIMLSLDPIIINQG